MISHHKATWITWPMLYGWPFFRQNSTVSLPNFQIFRLRRAKTRPCLRVRGIGRRRWWIRMDERAVCCCAEHQLRPYWIDACERLQPCSAASPRLVGRDSVPYGTRIHVCTLCSTCICACACRYRVMANAEENIGCEYA